MGNNIIETEGMRALCASLTVNNSLRYVDLKQNIFDIESEIALQEVVLAKKGRLNISWKKPPAKGDPPMPKSDIVAIINHFGASRILSLYGSGQTLEPLVDIELVLLHIKYSSQEAKQIWDIAFPLKVTFYFGILHWIRVVDSTIHWM